MQNTLPFSKVVLKITAIRKKGISFGVQGVCTWVDDGEVEFVAFVDEATSPTNHGVMKNEVCIPALSRMGDARTSYFYKSHIVQGRVAQSIQEPVDFCLQELNYKTMLAGL